MAKTKLKLKRAYEKPEKGDGYRILIDRLWPRGLAKKEAKIDLWMKDVAPSNELRKWFGHDPEKWAEFQKRYKLELVKAKDPANDLKKTIREKKIVTLVYSAANDAHNNAVALKKLLRL
ncbi:MAG TPA: DUF488 family protein [Candidatus Bathyarchaeia archaeon]|nr:DUF488 family protein [Candidatus Bathyarchaeia archaeon]